MIASYYKGGDRSVVWTDASTTGVIVVQNYDDGECSAACGKCYHLLHTDIHEGGSGAWKCSDPECGAKYMLPLKPNSSRYTPNRFKGDAATVKADFALWVNAWTGVGLSNITVTLEWVG